MTDSVNNKRRLVTICDWTRHKKICKWSGGHFLCEQKHLSEATNVQSKTNSDMAIQNALQAAAKMSDVMDRSVAASFDRPGLNLFIASFAALALGVGFLPIVAAGTFGMGFIVAAKAMLVTAACCLGAGTIGFSYGIITSYPSHKFSLASRALLRASNKLPETARTLFHKFSKTANALFAFAYAASVQKRIVDGKETSRALSNAEDDAYVSLKTGLGTCGMWSRREFRERKVPNAEVFRREFSDASARLEENVRNRSRNANSPIRVEPNHAT